MWLLALATLITPAAASQELPKPADAKVAQLAWLAGSWSGTAGASTIEEHWTAPAGGAMLAVARTIRDGRLRAFEYLRIVEKGSTLVYLAMPNGRAPATEFTLTSVSDASVTFENPSHDFPKKIQYSLGADGVLQAIVSGTVGQTPQTFRLTRQHAKAAGQ